MEEEWTDTNAAIEQVWADYPEAKEFGDLIAATTVDEFRDVARDIAAKVRKTKGATSQPSTPPRTPKPKSEAVSVQDAIQNRSWPDYLKAKWDSQEDDRA